MKTPDFSAKEVTSPDAVDHERHQRPKKRTWTGGITSYRVGKQILWKIRVYLKLPDGQRMEFRQRAIPTQELAKALVAKKRAEAFEGRFFERQRVNTLKVREVWELYKPISKRDNDSFSTDQARGEHLLRHLGDRLVAKLTVGDVDAYRTLRLGEKTRRKLPPSPAQLDREVELLKRMCNYAVATGKLKVNPVAGAKLLKKSNVRNMVIDEEQFQKLLEQADAPLKPILVVAFDTGMRKQEVLRLRWDQVDLKTKCVRLSARDTKTEEPRVIPMTARVYELLKRIPRQLVVEWVFVSEVQRKGQKSKPWSDIGGMFSRATTKVGMPDLWFHDLRRSFITKARRRGIPESVVMRLSGHRTNAVFQRYNVVEEDDLHDAIQKLEIRQSVGKAAESATAKEEAPSGSTEKAS